MCSKKNRRFITHVFNMITGKNESKMLTKDISSEYKYKFDRKKM